jgi:hypothetical protein
MLVIGIAQVEKEGKVTRVHLTHDRFTRTPDNKFKYRNMVPPSRGLERTSRTALTGAL